MSHHIFARPIVVIALLRVLAALDFLHGPANLTHTGKAALAILDFCAHSYLGSNPRCPCRQSHYRCRQFAEFEENELVRSSSRKTVDGITIHVSQFLLENFGPLYLCDFGESRTGSQHEWVAVSVQYRAPETILGMPWGHSVDMWSVGLLV